MDIISNWILEVVFFQLWDHKNKNKLVSSSMCVTKNPKKRTVWFPSSDVQKMYRLYKMMFKVLNLICWTENRRELNKVQFMLLKAWQKLKEYLVKILINSWTHGEMIGQVVPIKSSSISACLAWRYARTARYLLQTPKLRESATTKYLS